MNALEKYDDSLNRIPPPGGNGCHPHLLRVANYGVLAGLDDGRVFSDIRTRLPAGTRVVPDIEILDAIATARNNGPNQSNPSGARTPGKFMTNTQSRRILRPGDAAIFIERGNGTTEDDLLEASPVGILPAPEFLSTLQLLAALYRDDDILFLGARHGRQVETVGTWKQAIMAARNTPWPHIIPNPLTGQQHGTKNGKPSFRCDAAVKEFRIAIAEFDNLPMADQLAFWVGIPLKIHALINSGGKSIHAWIKVIGIENADEWNRQIRIGLYQQRLIPLGVDQNCKNESRLSRLPGHFRADKRAFQQLLYLDPNPDGTPIIERIRAKGAIHA